MRVAARSGTTKPLTIILVVVGILIAIPIAIVSALAVSYNIQHETGYTKIKKEISRIDEDSSSPSVSIKCHDKELSPMCEASYEAPGSVLAPILEAKGYSVTLTERGQISYATHPSSNIRISGLYNGADTTLFFYIRSN